LIELGARELHKSLHTHLSFELGSLTLVPPPANQELYMLIQRLKLYIMPCHERLQFVINALREKKDRNNNRKFSTNYLMAMDPLGTLLE